MICVFGDMMCGFFFGGESVGVEEIFVCFFLEEFLKYVLCLSFNLMFKELFFLFIIL